MQTTKELRAGLAFCKITMNMQDTKFDPIASQIGFRHLVIIQWHSSVTHTSARAWRWKHAWS